MRHLLTGRHRSATSTRVGFTNTNPVKILFEELFYNKTNKPFRVFCIDDALEGEVSQPTASSTSSSDEPEPELPLVPTFEAYADTNTTLSK